MEFVWDHWFEQGHVAHRGDYGDGCLWDDNTKSHTDRYISEKPVTVMFWTYSKDDGINYMPLKHHNPFLKLHFGTSLITSYLHAHGT
jgi:hypothetical protein